MAGRADGSADRQRRERFGLVGSCRAAGGAPTAWLLPGRARLLVRPPPQHRPHQVGLTRCRWPGLARRGPVPSRSPVMVASTGESV